MRKEGFGKLVSLDAAKEILFSLSKEVDAEKVSIDDALGRVLAEDIAASVDVPPFAKSAMDGYAVIASDTFGASNTQHKILKQIGQVYPGDFPDEKVGESTCFEIATGAPIPEGADAVLMVEYTEKNDDEITIYRAVAPGENVIKAGSDIKSGTKVLEKGVILNPRLSAVLAATGISEVPVKRKPIVAVCSTGNELVRAPEKLGKGQIYETNARSLIDGLREIQCEPLDLGIAVDDKDDLRAKIIDAVQNADIVLLTGGSSMGATDLLVEVLSELGEVIVHGIAVKPGKPTIISKVNDKIVFGLPGHPASALSNFYILVKPLIYQMLGTEKPADIVVEAKITRKIASTIGRYEFLAVRTYENAGELFAEPVLKGSSAITTLANASGFVEIDENVEVVEKHNIVKVKLF